VSEMVASDDYVRGGEESRLRAEGAGVDPHVVQIAGCQPRWMGEAARLAEASGAAVIDINMGCPAKRVTGGYAGSALMRDLSLALQLIETTVKAVTIPVALKMRLGWDHASLNAPELASRAEAAGVKLVTVHGRTRCQFYSGKADWSAVQAVKQVVSVPVVVNGDCATLADAQTMLALSGADAVMVGRAAIGRPWLVGALARGLAGLPDMPPSVEARLDAAREHVDSLLTTMGAEKGLRHARKHLSAYAERAGAWEALRLRLVTSDRPRAVLALLGAVFGVDEDAPTRMPEAA
jgi:tRNA-dihydrouridine synthase B